MGGTNKSGEFFCDELYVDVNKSFCIFRDHFGDAGWEDETPDFNSKVN